jgi:hypothetical protein
MPSKPWIEEVGFATAIYSIHPRHRFGRYDLSVVAKSRSSPIARRVGVRQQRHGLVLSAIGSDGDYFGNHDAKFYAINDGTKSGICLGEGTDSPAIGSDGTIYSAAKTRSCTRSALQSEPWEVNRGK